MTSADLALVLDWAADEGWNPGLDDAEAFLAADPEGFFVAEHDGQPVAAISVVNHGDDFAFLGLYICRPSHRGRGIGLALWQRALEHAGDRTVGLDGVPDQQANYLRSGFHHTGATTRFSGRIAPDRHDRIRSATPDDLPALIDLEAQASGTLKPAYLTAWFTGTDRRQTWLVEQDGRITGLVTARACREGAKIGPLIAPDAETAQALMRHAAHRFGDAIIIDVPETSAPLVRLCESLALEPGFHTARMYRGTPVVPGSNHYAVTTLELG